MFIPVLLISSGFLAGVAIATDTARSPQRPSLMPGDAPDAVPSSQDIERIEIASSQFLPFASTVAVDAVEKEGSLLPSWREAVSFLPGLTEAVALYFTMADEKTPFHIKALAAMALVYAISPVDFIPDEIPGLGQIDDLAVIFFTYRQVAPWVGPEHYAEATLWLASHDIKAKPFLELGNILDMEKWATQYYEEEGTGQPQLTGPT